MVYFNMYGRLGNLLFQYATAATLGKGEAVGVTRDPAVRRAAEKGGHFFRNLKIVDEAPPGARVIRQYKYEPPKLEAGDGGDVLLDGYFQSDRYFDAGVARSLFAVPGDVAARLRERYGEALSRPGVTSVHVRRGDYLTMAQCHPFVGERYFRDCLRRLPDVRDFVVCSDDIAWCREFFPGTFAGRRFTFSENDNPVDDLCLCSMCENNIMSNSSFSWWGAWLNGRPSRRILVPSMWFGFAIARRGGRDWSLFYPQGAEIVRNGYSPSLWLKAHWADLTWRFRR